MTKQHSYDVHFDVQYYSDENLKRRFEKLGFSTSTVCGIAAMIAFLIFSGVESFYGDKGFRSSWYRFSIQSLEWKTPEFDTSSGCVSISGS